MWGEWADDSATASTREDSDMTRLRQKALLTTAAAITICLSACGDAPEAEMASEAPAQDTPGQAVAAQTSAQRSADAALDLTSPERLPVDEIVYFMLPDRFENGDPGNDKRSDHDNMPSGYKCIGDSMSKSSQPTIQ